jgi:hypothetical protein
MHEAFANALPATAALAAVLALVVLTGRALKSTALNRVRPPIAGSAGSRLAILDTMTIDRSRRLHVIQWHDREVVLLTGGPSDQVVGWLPSKANEQ